MDRHQRMDDATYSSLDYDFVVGITRTVQQHKKQKSSAWSRGPKLLKRLFRRRRGIAVMEDQKTVNLSADSTTPMDTDTTTAASLSYAAASSAFTRPNKKSLPDKQVYYMPKFTDPSAAFGSDDVESFFAQLDVKDDSAKVFLALEGTEVVLCPDDGDLLHEELGNVSNLDEDIFTSGPEQPWSGVPRDTHPVTEICFSNDDVEFSQFDESGFSNSFDQINLRKEIFASFIDEEKCSDSTSSITKQQKHKNIASFQTKSTGSNSIDIPCQSSLTSSPKQTTAMLKRKSAFTGQDLLTQEAEVFSEFLEENSPDKPPSPISASRSKKIAESRLISALNAVDVSDDDDSVEPSEFELHKYYSTAAAARNAAAEAAASLPAYSRTDASSTTSDVFSRINTQADTASAIDTTSRLSYETGELSKDSYAASFPSAALRRIENDDLCMGFFFPSDVGDDDLSLRSDDLSDLSHFNNTPTEEAFVKLQRMAREGTSDFFGLLK